MTVLPIVERELRVASRNPATYRMRLSIASMVTVIFMFFTFVSSVQTPQQTGQGLFTLSFCLLFLACLFGGSQLTADCISSEKREGTLGFLFLTDLKGYDIVLGKLATNSLGALYGMLSLLPLISVIFLFGGVTGEAMLRMSLACLNVLLLSLVVGLIGSCLGKEQGKVRGYALALTMALISVGPMTGGAWARLNGLDPNSQSAAYWAPFLMTSPMTVLITGLDLVYSRYPTLYWQANAVTFGMGLGCLGLACWLAPRTWQDRAASRRGFMWQQWWRGCVYGRGPAMGEFRKRLLDINAVHWLTSRQRLQLPFLWGALLVVPALWFVLWALEGRDWIVEGSVLPLCIMVNLALRVGVAMESAGHIAKARESGALELLLCTSMPVSEILRGQWLSIQRVYLRPFIFVSLAEGLLLFLLILRQPSLLDVEFAAVILACLIILWTDYLVLPWVGMWQAISSKNPKNAGIEAASIILGQPWALTYLVGLLFSLAAAYFRIQVEMEIILGVCWFSFSMIVNWWWYRRSRTLLEREFRELAMNRYIPGERLTVWGRLGRFLGRHLRWPWRSK